MRAKKALAALLASNEYPNMPAVVHPAAHGLYYATGVFGGIRATCIEADDGFNKLGVFLSDLHAQRFLDHMVEMALVPEDHELTAERMVE